MTTHPDALSQDVELALQAAIGHANNPYADLNAAQAVDGGKKSRKRMYGEEPGEEESHKKKRNSKPKVSNAIVNTNPIHSSTSSMAVSPLTRSVNSSAIPIVKPQKQKKKRKEKGKQTVSDSAPPPPVMQSNDSIPIDPSLLNIRSTLPTDELVAALKRVTSTDIHGSSVPMPPLQDLVSDAAGDASEELLRILQELDLPKIAGVLKSFGNLADGSLQPLPFGSAPLQEHSTGETSLILPNPSTRSLGPTASRRVPTHQATQPVETGNQNHAYLLANKWFSSTKLAEMAKHEGSSLCHL